MQPLYLEPCAAPFAAGTEIATESGSVQMTVPCVKSKRCMVTFRRPAIYFHLQVVVVHFRPYCDPRMVVLWLTIASSQLTRQVFLAP
jgi:hypothetical protein